VLQKLGRDGEVLTGEGEQRVEIAEMEKANIYRRHQPAPKRKRQLRGPELSQVTHRRPARPALPHTHGDPVNQPDQGSGNRGKRKNGRRPTDSCHSAEQLQLAIVFHSEEGRSPNRSRGHDEVSHESPMCVLHHCDVAPAYVALFASADRH
jgi:hypothetical protein